MRRSGFASFLVFVLCLSLIAGASYALLTSEDKSNIAITSGSVNVTAELEKAEGEWVYSPTLIDYNKNNVTDPTNAANQETGAFVNGGFAALNEEKLTLTNMTPGDKVMLNIRISNESTVAVKYSTRLWVSADTGLFEGLDISVNDEPFTFTQQTSWETMEVGSEDIVIPVVIKLPEETGNDYQDTGVEISFSVSAVQANADTATLENNAPDTFYLYSASDLFMFAKSVEDGNTYASKTVVLLNSVNLGGKEWKPVCQTGNEYGTFLGNFDGNGKTVSNFYIDTTDGFYPNGADVATGFFGWLEGDQKISNLTLDHFSVTAYRRPAGIVGYMSGNASVTNCHVKNATIKAVFEFVEAGDDYGWNNGDKAGAISGMINHQNVIDGCTVTDTKIYGYRDIGGIVGYNYGSVKNCEVSGLTIVAGGEHNYKNYATEAEFDADELVGEGNAATDSTATGVEISVNIIASNDAVLSKLISDAAENEATVITLAEGTFALPTSIGKKNITFKGTKDTVLSVPANSSATGANITFDGLTISGYTCPGGKDDWHSGQLKEATKVTYKNCTIIDLITTYSDVDFIGCVFENDFEDQYSVYCYGNTVNFTDCIFNTDCSKAIKIYNDSYMDITVNVTNCEFYASQFDKAAIEIDSTLATEGYTVTIKNCTTNEYYQKLWNDRFTKSTVTVTPAE